MRKILVMAFFFAVGAVGIDASAQEFTGSIYGRIVDPTNALLPGVSITVEGDAIQGKRTAVSEANGSYRLLNLPQGEYRVTYQKARFKKLVYKGAKIEVNKTITMNVTMQIADIEETLVVTGSSPIVDVKNATVGTNFGEAMLSDIPGQRDIFALLAQTPGITMPRMDIGGNTAGTQSAYRAYGLSGQSVTTVDGVNITAGLRRRRRLPRLRCAGWSEDFRGGKLGRRCRGGRRGDHGDQERQQQDARRGLRRRQTRQQQTLHRRRKTLCCIATSMASSAARSSRTGSGTSRQSAISTPSSPPGCTTSRQTRAAKMVRCSSPQRRITPSS